MTTVTKHRWVETQEDVSGAFKTTDGTSFPRNWLTLATADDLARYGIEAYEHTTPDPDPHVPTDAELLDDEYPPLQKYQFDAMVDYLGLDAAIDNVINSMPDGIEKSLTRSLRKNGVDGYFRRSSPLFTSIAASPDVPIDDGGINAAWSTARAL